MKAMILAAGLGTRLHPYTQEIPKALIPVNGIPLLEIQINRLKRFGFHELIINIHHRGQQVIDFLKSRQFFGLQIHISDERNLLLDTGGALKKAMHLLGDDEPVLIHNVDVITSLDLAAFMQHHTQSGALASLCVQDRASSRYFFFNAANQLCGWADRKKGEEKWVASPGTDYKERAFSGIHIVGPQFFTTASIHRCFPDQNNVFSIVDVYLCLAAFGKIFGYDHSNDLWMDLGKPHQLKAAEDLLIQKGNTF